MGLRWPRQRRAETVLGIACATFAVVSLAVVAGLVPGVLPPSPASFSQDVPVCSESVSAGASTRSLILPVWASVRVAWSVDPSSLLVVYEITTASLQTVYFAEGANGTGSFESVGGTYLFTPVFVQYFPPPLNATCTTADVLVTVTYTP
jgi:hypothetical protein